jgi:hypothetical protein
MNRSLAAWFTSWSNATAEKFVEPLGGAEQAADAADVLPQHDHVRVDGELVVEGFPDRGHEAQRSVARGRRLGMGAMRCQYGREQIVGAGVLVGERGVDRRLDLGCDGVPERRDALVVQLAEVAQHALEPRQRIVPRRPRRDPARRAGWRASSAACA